MIKFTRCEIDERGESLIIEASIDNMSYYDNVYIDSIIINTEESYSPNGPDEVKGKRIDFADEEGDYTKKHISIRLCPKDLDGINLNNNILFVYAVATGVPSPDVPCGMDNIYTMTIAMNMRPIYNMAMQYINELNSRCDVPRGFIDMFIRLKAFSLSLRTGNIQKAIDLWKTFKNKKFVSFKGCGCHGINR